VTDDWFDLLVAMLDARARFLVIGEHALAVHGVPRGTQDLDLWIEPTPGNAVRVWAALAAFGAPLEGLALKQADLIRADSVVQFGLPPNRVNILAGISGVPSFESAWTGRIEQQVRGRSIPFLGRAALVDNKRASGRPKDLADLDALGEKP
jgi:hypothetical protein